MRYCMTVVGIRYVSLASALNAALLTQHPLSSLVNTC